MTYFILRMRVNADNWIQKPGSSSKRDPLSTATDVAPSAPLADSICIAGQPHPVASTQEVRAPTLGYRLPGLLLFPGMSADQRNKSDGLPHPATQMTFATYIDNKVLAIALTLRDHHAATDLQLIQERLRSFR